MKIQAIQWLKDCKPCTVVRNAVSLRLMRSPPSLDRRPNLLKMINRDVAKYSNKGWGLYKCKRHSRLWHRHGQTVSPKFVMPGSSLRNAVKGRSHKERGQLAHRSKLGLLEKKKDYVLRARNYHSKQNTLRRLREKAATRNKDEFYFAMTNQRTEVRI